ncbi:MAG: hypothetical protein RBT67_07610 [Thauera sp.]|nr:hypothetical protein [Thauera sp.]
MADTAPDLSFKAFADHLGCRPSYVTELRTSGRLVLTDDGKRVLVAESLERIQATRDPARDDVSQRHAEARATKAAADTEVDEPGSADASGDPAADADGSDEIGNGYQAARAVKERYLAMSAKRDYEVSIGKLVPAADVRQAIAGAVTTLRTDLENLPDTLAPVLAAETDEARCRLLLADEIEHILGNLAARFEKIAKEEAA